MRPYQKKKNETNRRNPRDHNTRCKPQDNYIRIPPAFDDFFCFLDAGLVIGSAPWHGAESSSASSFVVAILPNKGSSSPNSMYVLLSTLSTTPRSKKKKRSALSRYTWTAGTRRFDARRPILATLPECFRYLEREQGCGV